MYSIKLKAQWSKEMANDMNGVENYHYDQIFFDKVKLFQGIALHIVYISPKGGKVVYIKNNMYLKMFILNDSNNKEFISYHNKWVLFERYRLDNGVDLLKAHNLFKEKKLKICKEWCEEKIGSLEKEINTLKKIS